jgi:RHS repeat-associated protein
VMLNYLLAKPRASFRTPQRQPAASAFVYLYRNTAFGFPYSPATQISEGLTQRYTFQGREASAHAGAPMYYRNRMYAAGLGRFGRRDPVQDESNLYNPYSAMGASAVGRTDPMGLKIVTNKEKDKEWTDKKLADFVRVLHIGEGSETHKVLMWMFKSPRAFELCCDWEVAAVLAEHEKFRRNVALAGAALGDQVGKKYIRFKTRSPQINLLTTPPSHYIAGPSFPVGGPWEVKEDREPIGEPVAVAYRSRGGDIVSAPGYTPAEAIEHIFSGRPEYPYEFDCFRAANLVVLRAISQTVGSTSFNANYVEGRITQPFGGASLTSLGVGVVRLEQGESWQWIIGDVGQFGNPGGSSPFAGEYAVFVGWGKYATNPFGVVTLGELRDKLQALVHGADRSKYVELKQPDKIDRVDPVWLYKLSTKK